MDSVDIRDLLDEHGNIPPEPAKQRRVALRLARLIEAGAPLLIGENEETLVECSKRPGRKPWAGLMRVAKQASGAIYALCQVCGRDEVRIVGWQDTRWARVDVNLNIG